MTLSNTQDEGLLPVAWLYESEDGSKELILDCNSEYARRLIENGYTGMPLFSRPSTPVVGEVERLIHWLRHDLDDWPDYVAPADIADAIERGEHLNDGGENVAG
jgi:hypothetical protein